jgi:hypothetical protein
MTQPTGTSVSVTARPVFKVSPGDVDNFAKVWTHSGLFFPMNDMSRQFATDFANVAIRSFIDFTVEQAKAKQAQAAQAAAPKIILAS